MDNIKNNLTNLYTEEAKGTNMDENRSNTIEEYDYYYIDPDMDMHSDYYNIGHRANEVLTQPDQIIALILGFIAVLLNLLTLVALSKTRGRITTHFRFMISLAVSDMLIGLTIIAFVINQVVNPSYGYGEGPEIERLKSKCAYIVIKAVHNIGLIVCLLNLLGMAIDHFVAITQPLHYPQLLNKKRSITLIISLWVVAILCGFSDFFAALGVVNKWKHKYNYCEIVDITVYREEYAIFAIASVAAVVMIYIYGRIYIAVRSHKIPGEQGSFQDAFSKEGNTAASHGSVRSRVRRSNRALKTTLLIVVTFVVCWLPLCIFQMALIIQWKKDKSKLVSPQIEYILTLMNKYLLDLLLVNTIADPVIYTVRLEEVQLGYKRLFTSMIRCDTLRKMLRFHNHNEGQYQYSRNNIFREDSAVQSKRTSKNEGYLESRVSGGSSCKCSQISNKESNKNPQELYQ